MNGAGSIADAQAIAWIEVVLRRAARRMDRVEKQRASVEILIFDAPRRAADSIEKGAATWRDQADTEPSVEDVVAASVDLVFLTQLLTPREAALMCLFLKGYGIKDAAIRLGISVRTVERERTRIARAMQIQRWLSS